MPSLDVAQMEARAQVLRHRLGKVMVTGRYSITLVWQMAFISLQASLNPFNPINEIAGLEGAASHRHTRTKPPTEFLHPPLKGLWHKHFSEGRHVAQVVMNRWGKKSLRELLKSVVNDSSITIEEKSRILADRFVQGGMDDQARHNKLTGDWIVYDRRDGVNTYLTLAGHNETPEAIMARVLECRVEFPELFVFKPDR